MAVAKRCEMAEQKIVEKWLAGDAEHGQQQPECVRGEPERPQGQEGKDGQRGAIGDGCDGAAEMEPEARRDVALGDRIAFPDEINDGFGAGPSVKAITASTSLSPAFTR